MNICIYFQVHQPRRVKKYRIFDIGRDSNYFNDDSETNLNNKRVFDKVTKKCYLPATQILYDLVKANPKFKISFSFSGVFLEQLEEYQPQVLKLFQKLIDTGQVEILTETYYHSLSFLYSVDEFKSQVKLHQEKIYQLFKFKPKVFRNTELIYNNSLGVLVEKLGFKGVLTEGADHILGWRSPNFLYSPVGTKKLKLLLKNYKLSDDIAFRFSSRVWSEYPLTAGKFASWVGEAEGDLINLFMDYETFGEHQWEDSGIFEFLKSMPGEVLKNPKLGFITPFEAVSKYETTSSLDIPNFISWADVERDLSAWVSNPMQHDALSKLYELEKGILLSNDPKLIEDWRKLTTSDHFYYMCTKWFADGDVHKYFNPYDSPYKAFISFMNVLQDLEFRVKNPETTPTKSEIRNSKFETI